MNREELLKLLEEIKEPEYRRAFVEGHAKDTIAFQIRQLRNARDWEQRDLARELGNPKLQPMISRYENPDYGRYSITTLLELAAAFDVALIVRFAPFSELVEWDLNATSKTLSPAQYSEDRQLNKLEKYASALQNVSGQSGLGASYTAPQMGSLLGGSGQEQTSTAVGIGAVA
jgi:transcriptional regulator with XRE-family HTH domain